MSSDHEESTNAVHIWLHVQSALLGVIFVSTLTFNSLLIIVLRKMKSRRSNRDCASYNIERSYMYLLFHLALADMLGVILNIPFDIFMNAGVTYYFTSAGCQILPPFQLASTTAQAGTYVALSYHRFQAIVYPIRATLTVYKSLIMIAMIWVVSICLSMPFVIVHKFEVQSLCYEDWDQESGNIYTYVIFIVQYAGPVLLMAVFYIAIARTLHEHRIAKELIDVPTQDDVRSHKHIVKMLVTIVTVYSVCMLPHHVIWITAGLHDFSETVYKTMSSVSYIFTYSNSVANPVVFFFYNKESRYHLRRFFKELCCARNMEVPFEIKKWSATWSNNSKSDSQRTHERRSSKDQMKLDKLFLAKPGDSDLGVSLPWEAQVMNSQGSSEEYRDYDHSPPRLPKLSLSPGNPLEYVNDTTNPFMYYGVTQGTKRYPSETTLEIAHEDDELVMEDDACVGVCDEDTLREDDKGCGQLVSDSGKEVSVDDDEGNEVSARDDEGNEMSIGDTDGNEVSFGDDEGYGVSVEDPEGYELSVGDTEGNEVFIGDKEGSPKEEQEGVCDESPWDEEDTETASDYSEDDTTRVQNMIERMMQDIRQELKQDGGMNGMKRLEDILNLNESSNGLNGSMTHLGTSAQDLVKDMTGYLQRNQEQGSERDIHGLRERLDSLPETRM